MRTILLLSALALGAAPLCAQNLVPNGDFSNGLTGWTETGFSVSSGIETFDTTGLGADPCYACNHGGQATPSPYPPNSIDTMVPLASGVPYELTADIAVNRTASGGNADAGTFWAEVAGVEVARIATGSYVSLETKRLRLCGRFTPTVSGMQPLKVFFHRTFLANTGTPRARLDNVSLQIAPGPTFCMQGNRKIGTTVQVEAHGEANAQVAFFLAVNRTSGLPIPGIGTLFLDPLSIASFFSATLDTNGAHNHSRAIPNNTYLLVVPLYVQGVMLASGRTTLGYDQFLTFTQ